MAIPGLKVRCWQDCYIYGSSRGESFFFSFWRPPILLGLCPLPPSLRPVYVCSVTQSCPTLCGYIDYNLPGFSAHWILQAGVLEWYATSYSRDLPNPGIKFSSLTSPALAGGFVTTSATWEAQGQQHSIPWHFFFVVTPCLTMAGKGSLLSGVMRLDGSTCVFRILSQFPHP